METSKDWQKKIKEVGNVAKGKYREAQGNKVANEMDAYATNLKEAKIGFLTGTRMADEALAKEADSNDASGTGRGGASQVAARKERIQT